MVSDGSDPAIGRFLAEFSNDYRDIWERAIPQSRKWIQMSLSDSQRIDLLSLALRSVAHTQGAEPCWCGVAIDNPMMGGHHSGSCEQARRILKEAGSDASKPCPTCSLVGRHDWACFQENLEALDDE